MPLLQWDFSNRSIKILEGSYEMPVRSACNSKNIMAHKVWPQEHSKPKLMNFSINKVVFLCELD